MGRNPRYSDFDDDRIKKIIYLTGAILAIGVLIFTIAYMLYGNNSDSEIDTQDFAYLNTITNTTNQSTQNTLNTDAEQASTPIGKSVYEMQNNTVSENVVNNTTNTTTVAENKENTKTSSTTNVKEEPEEESVETTLIEQVNPDPTFIKPCEGNIIREFAKDKFVYSDTLKEWVSHYGIDIQADSTSVVKSSEAGTVKSIKNDPRYGLTVVISHANGFSTVYSNLATAEFVVEGEEVEEGQTIGTVGNTATFEILDESHLHFEMLKDGEYVDPEIYCR